MSRSRLTSGHQGVLSRLTGAEWGERPSLTGREETFGVPRGMLVAGAVAVGAGLLAWHFLGPDVRRYLKIHSM